MDNHRMADPTLLTIMEFAKLYGVNSRTIRSWFEGLIPTGKNRGQGQGNLYSLPSVVSHLYGTRDEGGEVLDLNTERARLAKEQADKASRENAIASGDVFLWSQFAPELERALTEVRTKMQAAPRKLAPQVVGVQTVTEIEAIIDGGIREALEGASLDRLNTPANPEADPAP